MDPRYETEALLAGCEIVSYTVITSNLKINYREFYNSNTCLKLKKHKYLNINFLMIGSTDFVGHVTSSGRYIFCRTVHWVSWNLPTNFQQSVQISGHQWIFTKDSGTLSAYLPYVQCAAVSTQFSLRIWPPHQWLNSPVCQSCRINDTCNNINHCKSNF